MMLLHLLVFLFLCCSCVTIEVLNLPEGSPCMNKNVSGTCVSIYNCLSSYIDETSRNNAPVTALTADFGLNSFNSNNQWINICSIRGKEPILCCTDCTFNDTRNIVINPYVGIIQKTGNKVQDKCIDHIHRLDYYCKTKYNATMTRVYKPDTNCHEVKINVEQVWSEGGVGGRDAKRDEFPHMALLGYGDDVRTANWLCGGAVISERFILTAGHCLSSIVSGPVKYATLGILKRSDPPELWQIYNVKRRIPHPEYKPPSKYHDIALLETDIEIIFSRQVLPACLHAAGDAGDYFSSALGWGALGHKRELADTLQTVPVTRYEEEECFKFYAPHRHLKNGYNHTTQMCYGDKEVLRDTCEGDSGGPLQYYRNDYTDKLLCVYTITGVTSYGSQCGIAPSPGIYTRVIYYVPWIQSIVWP